jgi:hypothetical protein
VNPIDLIVDALNQELVQSRRNTTIDMNPITIKNNTIVTLHLDDEERGKEQLAPHGELHGDNASSLYWVAPHAVPRQDSLHEPLVLLYKLLEDVT